MRMFGLVLGAIISLIGLSIMFTPLRTYFVIGWITGVVLLLQGIPMFFSGVKRKSRGKMIAGLITTIVSLLLLVSDLQQMLTMTITVYLVAGGILLSGFVEFFIGMQLLKKDRNGLVATVTGAISIVVGLAGLIFKETTVLVIGFIVGVHILRLGISIFFQAKNMDKPQVIDLPEN